MILVKTEAGHQVLKDRSLRLTPRQRSAFILFDGKRSVNDVVEAGMGIAREDIEQMVELGLLGQVNGSNDMAHGAGAASAVPDLPQRAVDAPAVPIGQVAGPERMSQQRYKDAYPIATQLTGSLGLRGFRLNLSVEGTSNYEELVELLPKIRAAVGPEKAAALERALLE